MKTTDKSKEQLLKENSKLKLEITNLKKSGLKISTGNQSESSLKESEEIYKAMYEQAPLSYQSLDIDGNFLDVNPKWLSTLGYKKDEVIGKWFGDFLRADFVEHFRKNFSEFKRLGSISDVQFYIRKKSGKYIYISFEGCIGYTPEGEFKQTYCVFKDITQEYEYKNSLIESEEKYHSIFDNIIDVYYEASLDGKIIEISPSVETFSKGQLLRNEIMGSNFLDFYAKPEERDALLKQLYEQKSVTNFEILVLNKDGSVIPCIVSSILHFDAQGNPDKIIGSLRDISNRKLAEQELIKSKEKIEESEKHYRTLFNESPIPMWEEDFSEVKKFIDEIKKDNVKDFRQYFDDRPEEIKKAAELVKIIDINRASVLLYEAKSKEELLAGLDTVFTEDSYTAFKEEVIAITEGKTKYNFEGVVKTLKGKLRHIQLAWRVLPGYEDSLERVFISTIDITESKKLAETVLQEKNKAQQYLDIAEVMMVSIDSSGIVKLINPKGCEVLGYTEEEIVGYNWFDKFLPERLRENVKAVSEKVFAGEMESVDYYENEILTKAGDERLIAWNNAVYKDEEGNVIGSLSSGEDITERKATEVKLQKSEDRLSKTLMAANDGMWDWNLITNEVYFDPRYYQMAGYKVDEFLYELQEFQTRVHPEDIESVMSQVQIHLNGETSQFNVEFRFKKKNGDWLWVAGRGKIVEYDENRKPLRFIGTHTDITFRKEAEVKLKENEANLSSLINNRNESIWSIDSSYNFMTFNSFFKKEYLDVFSTELVYGLNALNILTPQLLEFWKPRYDKALSGKREIFEFTIPMENKLHTYNVTLNPIILDGNVTGVSCLSVEITERKLAEEELAKHREHLEQLVIERTAEVDEKNQKLTDQIRVFVGRELKIRDLEKKIRLMEKESG